MRSAILLQPPAAVLDSVPSCFAEPVDEPSVREWLEHPAARSRLSAVPTHARFDEAVRRAVGLGERDDSVLVAYVAGLSVIDEAEWNELGFGDTFDETESRDDAQIEDWIDDANARFDSGDWDGAAEMFQRVHTRLEHEHSVRHAEVLVTLGDMARLAGRVPEAVQLIDRALAMAPKLPGALRARAALARSTGEPALAAAMWYRLALAEERPGARSEALLEIADDSLRAARDALEQARELDPHSVDLLGRLRAVYEAAGLWQDAVDVSVQIAEHAASPAERARQLALAARTCAERTGNIQRAVALYEAAIEDDPEVEGAFSAIEQVLVDSGDSAGLAQAYERQLARLDATGADEAERASLLERLATLQEDRLGDLAGAVQSLDRLVTFRPDDAVARGKMADLLARLGQDAAAARLLELGVEHQPFDATLYRRLGRLLQQSGEPARAFASSAVLVALGEAEPEEQLVYAEGAPRVPPRFSRSFDEDVWFELRPRDYPELVDRLFFALDRAAVHSWLEREQRSGTAALPPDNQRIDPETSTVSAVRSFHWAARLLGVADPALYAQPDNAKVGIATIRAAQPALLLGRPALTGRSVIELAFLAARHLTYLRPGYRILSFYPTTRDIGALVRAAVAIARTDGMAPTLDAAGQELGAQLRRHLGDPGLAEVRDILAGMHAQGENIDLYGWARAAETVACRAALIACGDVTVASTLLAVAGGPSAGLSARERLGDLYAFGVSQRCAALQRMLGISAG